MILDEKTCESLMDTFRTKYDETSKTWSGPKDEPDSLFKPSNLCVIGELITNALNKKSGYKILSNVAFVSD